MLASLSVLLGSTRTSFDVPVCVNMRGASEIEFAFVAAMARIADKAALVTNAPL
jgi:hypothetical protein